MTEYLLDTNILIYYINNSIPKEKLGYIEEVLLESYNISVITEIEILGWNKITKEEFSVIKEFLTQANKINIDRSIIETTIDLKRTINIKIPDAIIAETALVNDYTLITRNVDDFKNIKNFKIDNPFV